MIRADFSSFCTRAAGGFLRFDPSAVVFPKAARPSFLRFPAWCRERLARFSVPAAGRVFLRGSSEVDRLVHNQKAAGSSPAPATISRAARPPAAKNQKAHKAEVDLRRAVCFGLLDTGIFDEYNNWS